MKICVLIPCHNEAQAIGRLVEQVKHLGLDVVVVNDGSTDATGSIAESKKARVITISPCGGKGNALRKGFEYILSQVYDALIIMDGDGQHSPEDLPAFIEHYKTTRASVINGNRMANNRNMPFVRKMTNVVMSWMISLVCRQRVADSQCGYRLISCEVLRNIKLNSTNFEIESEILIKASKKGLKIDSVPVQTIYEDEQSKIRPVKDTIRFFKYLLRELRSDD
ncbi:MAG: glycosyltransferase family 2 protein [Candidatus Omnitrophica bacterium]|nr:glycosyltransferase family 2 protein [Candidatus Omnitrophota bacterium]